jgi:quercetin dioxygenase-like cupin family protein
MFSCSDDLANHTWYEKETNMYVVRLNDLHLPELGYAHDETARVSGTFPFSAAVGNKSTAMVYFELAPGKRLPIHTDTAEEILFILEGTAEVTLGDERVIASAGNLALVPALVPHGLRNIGENRVRVIGFFSSSTNMATFDYPLVPLDLPADMPSMFGERTVLAPLPAALEQTPSVFAAASAG